MSNIPAIIAFSHLRWDFVYQRPQHLFSRFASNRRAIFVEEPVFDTSSPHWERFCPAPNLEVFRPHTPIAEPGYSDEQFRLLRELIQQPLHDEQISDYILWFYTPMALPLIEGLRPRALVYDCMDELSAFRNAPAQLAGREAHLLKLADVVFTGGPSLYRAKKDRHPNVHCFPSSVDLNHYAPAAGGLEDPPDQAVLPRPRVGFFGVIDERTDLPLLDALARAHPEWQIVMVGPVVKIDSAQLPRHPNLHYFGQRPYKQLPAYLSSWDVAILPFARNHATRFISPTKTLEYMAAEKMIVSTPISDVADPYGDIVFVGETPTEFIRACEMAIAIPERERTARVTAMRDVLSRTSWDFTVRAMEQEIAKVIASRPLDREGSVAPLTRGKSPQRIADSRPAIVLGAGPTGLSAAYHLGEDALLIEQGDRVGGYCRSVQEGGFTFDFAGHIMFSNEAYVHKLYQMLLGDNVHWQDREAWIYSKNVYTRYPFQGSLYGLPPDVIRDCIVGAIEARFGPLRRSSGNASLTQTSNGHSNEYRNGQMNGKTNGHGDNCVPGGVQDCCADGILETSVPLDHRNGVEGKDAEPRNFEEFIYKVWGAGIAKHFAIPYNRKLWTVPLAEMETSWLGGRVPIPDLEEMLEGALSPTPKPMGPNARFGYPLHGGFQALMDAWLPLLKGELLMNSRVTSVSPARHTITLDTGQEYRYEQLISTMPLPALIRCMGAEAPPELRAAAAGLRHVSVRCVHLGVGREKLTEKHWIYYPEDTVFHRIFAQGNASPYCNPHGGFGLTCEITYSEYKPLPSEGDALIRRCIQDCQKVGILKPDDPIWATRQCDLPYAYVVYDHGRAGRVSTIRKWLSERNIHLAGRYSEWEYYNSDHAFVAGKKAADAVRQLQREMSLSDSSLRPPELVGLL